MYQTIFQKWLKKLFFKSQGEQSEPGEASLSYYYPISIIKHLLLIYRHNYDFDDII